MVTLTECCFASLAGDTVVFFVMLHAQREREKAIGVHGCVAVCMGERCAVLSIRDLCECRVPDAKCPPPVRDRCLCSCVRYNMKFTTGGSGQVGRFVIVVIPA